VRPRDVDLAIELDPAAGTGYRGEATFELELSSRRRSIELHAVDLRVSRPRIHVDGAVLRGKAVMHRDRETVEIRFDEKVPAGRARLELRFSGRLRRDLTGLYAASVGERRYAFSQLAPTSARRFFPCFDEPAMKARFSLQVTTASRHQVLSNSPAIRRERLADGRQTVVFERTPPLSSYLLALAVGDLECSHGAFAGSTEIRVWHVPGKAGLCDFALEAARESLLRLEAWFDLPYPYAKLDLVAVPDFEFGAMENPGAVFFRETLLLLDEKHATLAERKRAAEVICHELAHMWYGDLVTMAWWDDLWLNEAFATWMAFEIVDRWKPEWRMWQSFLAHRAAALDLDALAHTHPIYTPVRHDREAGQNFDVITYEKGAAVIRMIERFLGPEIFCAGVRKYVREHREGNAVAADLWQALSEVSGEAVEKVVGPWIEEPGYPVVRVTRSERGGLGVLELSQEIFRERPPKKGTRARGPRPRWPVPWVGRVGSGDDGHTRVVRHLLTRTRDTLPAEGADLTFVYGNADEAAFIRPQHDARDFEDLMNDLGSLTDMERTGFVDHKWALVRAGRSPVSELMDLLAALGTEQDPDVLAAASRPLATMARRLAPDLGPDIEGRLRAWIEVYYGGQIDDVGWEPAPGEDERRRQQRAALFEVVGRVGRASVLLAGARERCRAYLDDRDSLDPDLADAVTSMAAIGGDAALHERLVEALAGSRTPQDQRRFLLALADFEAPELVDRTLSLVTDDVVASQDVPFLMARLLENRAARERTWSTMKRRWRRLSRRMGTLSVSRVAAATPSLAGCVPRREVAAFFREHPLPSGRRPLDQALERFDWYSEYRRRAGPELADYLRGH
jgi:puromycin-sensitive aminopeptidase